MGGNINNTLSDKGINWAFSYHPEVRTGRITVQEEEIKERLADLPTAPLFCEPKQEKRTENPENASLLLTVS